VPAAGTNPIMTGRWPGRVTDAPEGDFPGGAGESPPRAAPKSRRRCRPVSQLHPLVAPPSPLTPLPAELPDIPDPPVPETPPPAGERQARPERQSDAVANP